jgi:hypothetical protein
VLFEHDSKYGYLFYTLLALLEWVQIPMVSNICYLFQQMSSPATVGVAFCSACLTVAAFFSTIYAIKACSYSENELLEKKITWALFTLISLTIFGIHAASPGFGETSSTFAAYFLVAVLVWGPHNISKLVSMNTLTPLAVFISELHAINLSCQAVCFLIVVNQLEHGELSDNENDSLLIFLTIIFDLVFIAI